MNRRGFLRSVLCVAAAPSALVFDPIEAHGFDADVDDAQDCRLTCSEFTKVLKQLYPQGRIDFIITSPPPMFGLLPKKRAL